MTDAEVTALAWREIIIAGQAYREDWVREVGEDPTDGARRLLAEMDRLLLGLEMEHS